MKTVVLIKKDDIKTSIYGNTIGIELGPDLLASITIEAMDELVEDYKILRAKIIPDASGAINDLENKQ